MGSLRLTTRLVPRGPAAAVVLDEEQVVAIGEGTKRFPVVATVNGYTWRTSVTRMSGEFLLGLNRAVREAAGVESGDIVEVSIELDQAPREVEVPKALADALAEDAQAERQKPPASPRRTASAVTAPGGAEKASPRAKAEKKSRVICRSRWRRRSPRRVVARGRPSARRACHRPGAGRTSAKKAATSRATSSGSSAAAKWPPRGIRVQRATS